MAVLSVGMLFLALSAAQGQTSINNPTEVPMVVFIPTETFVQGDIVVISDGCLVPEEGQEPENSEQFETDIENQEKFDPITPIPQQPLILPQYAPIFVISPEADEPPETEDELGAVDVSELPLDMEDIAAAIEGSKQAEIGIEAEEPDAGLGSNSADEVIEPAQTPDEEILTACMPEEAEPFEVTYRRISSDDFTSATDISQLVLEKSSNGYRAIQDMALVLTISNCSDKAIRVKGALQFEAGVAQLYEALGFTVPIQSEDFILGAGEEQSMTWTFICGQGLSSGTVSAFPGGADLAFRVDFSCEWDDGI